MDENKTIRVIYKLDYDKSNLNSGLVNWYNHLLDKKVDELDVVDVSKMIRQDILKEVAIDRAIDLFLSNPFDGEMQDGDLLTLLISINSNLIKNRKKCEDLSNAITELESSYLNFDWPDNQSKVLFKENLITFKQNINS
ncbi:MAG: hypothetical protein E7243_11380 [Lacrimispora celerecrescens]|uniref:contact-dependent growth inhibition system immunity protein n=1 Tax=Lacrimispora indolis TaxID=69825 RepID=UPI000462B662|nr:contact-dependent growth inhibition system immunity protein [[Clostridium] methoxybenzovorans]MBE7720105.1 hypothetical protein [Lacrimispora celerecrescens]